MCNDCDYTAQSDKPKKPSRRELLERIEFLEQTVGALNLLAHKPCAGPHWTATYPYINTPTTTPYPYTTWSSGSMPYNTAQ